MAGSIKPKPTVLVADDDRILAQLLNRRLRLLGMNVVLAADAMQAWMLALRVDPDVVVLDVGMPGGSGLDILERLKTSLRTNTVPVVLLTGSDQEKTAAEATALGADGFYQKSDDLEEFFKAICELCDVEYKSEADG